MSLFDKLKVQANGLKEKAVDAAAKNSDKINVGLDKAGEFVDKKTKGKYSDKIETGKTRAKEGLEKLDNTAGGDTRPPPPPGAFGTSAPPASADVPDAPPAPADDPDAPPPPMS